MSDLELKQADDRQTMKHDYLATALIIIGLISVGIGCHFHYVELSTAAASVVGAGTGLIVGKRNDTKTVSAGGNLAVTTGENA